MDEMNLVIQTAFLGDLILTVPTLRRIKKIQPHRKLGIVCKKGLGQFLKNEGVVDVVFEIEKSNSDSYKNALTEIQKFKINYLYCIHRSFRSLLFSSSIEAKKKVGFNSFLAFWLFDETVDFCPEYHEVLRQFKILETTDEETKRHFLDESRLIQDEFDFLIPEYFSFKNQTKKISSKRIAIFPGSVWATKKWTEEGFSELVKKLTQDGYAVHLHGAPDERELCERIKGDLKNVEVLAGEFQLDQTIKEVFNYDLVISNDSAPTHMASMQGTPVVTIFGPTTSKMGFRPWSKNSVVIEDKSLKCRPCGPHGHRVCPLKHHKCMTNISVDHVYEATVFLLNKYSN
jgi:heptosyltransferase-2